MGLSLVHGGGSKSIPDITNLLSLLRENFSPDVRKHLENIHSSC